MPTTNHRRTEPEFIDWTGSLVRTLTPDPESFGTNAMTLANYVTTRNRYVAAYDKVQEPITDSKPNRVAKNEARKTLENATKSLVDVMQAWPQMTNEKRTQLGINIRDRKPTRKPRPRMAPLVALQSQVGLTLNVMLLDSTDPERRGRPADVAGTSLLSFIGEVPPQDIAGWTFQGNTTKTKESITFPPATPPGAKVWVCAVFYNTRAETGPVSEAMGAHLAGVIGLSKAA